MTGFERFLIAGRIEMEESPLGGPVVRLSQGDAQCLVALHGGHVLNWTCRGEGLLWLSPAARIRYGKGIRGGIPVCWPWFGDSGGPGKPAHGFVRTRAWAVAGSQRRDDGVSLVLTTASTEADRALWPHGATATITITLGAALELHLETHNTGDTAFALTQALHTYFRVSDVANVAIDGLSGLGYLDKLLDFAERAQSGAIHFEREVDRIYQGDTSRIVLRDRGAGRQIEISSTGSRSAVVWNPWDEKTARLGDMGSADAFRQMVCIETANAGGDVITLAPGERHMLTARYAVNRRVR